MRKKKRVTVWLGIVCLCIVSLLLQGDVSAKLSSSSKGHCCFNGRVISNVTKMECDSKGGIFSTSKSVAQQKCAPRITSQSKKEKKVFCCVNYRVREITADQCKQQGGKPYNSNWEAKKKCKPKDVYCCIKGKAKKTSERTCKRNNSKIFHTSAEANKQCENETVYCCQNGSVSDMPLINCKRSRGTPFWSKNEAHNKCKPLKKYCCLDGKVQIMPKDVCKKRGGNSYSDRLVASRKCSSQRVYCCTEDGEVERLQRNVCERKRGKPFNNRAEANRTCGSQEVSCCVDGNVQRLQRNVCERRGGEPFNTRAEAYRECRPTERPVSYCCLNGQLERIPSEECYEKRGKVFTNEQEAEYNCGVKDVHCCINGKVSMLSPAKCEEDNGIPFSSRDEAAEKCTSDMKTFDGGRFEGTVQALMGYCCDENWYLREITKRECTEIGGQWWQSSTLSFTKEYWEKTCRPNSSFFDLEWTLPSQDAVYSDSIPIDLRVVNGKGSLAGVWLYDQHGHRLKAWRWTEGNGPQMDLTGRVSLSLPIPKGLVGENLFLGITAHMYGNTYGFGDWYERSPRFEIKGGSIVERALHPSAKKEEQEGVRSYEQSLDEINQDSAGPMARTQMDVGSQASSRGSVEIVSPAGGDAYYKPAILQVKYRVQALSESRMVTFILVSSTRGQVAVKRHLYEPPSLDNIDFENLEEVDPTGFNLGSEGELADIYNNLFEWPLANQSSGEYYLEARTTTPSGFSLLGRSGYFSIESGIGDSGQFENVETGVGEGGLFESDEPGDYHGVEVHLRGGSAVRRTGDNIVVDLNLLGEGGPGFPPTAYPMGQPMMLYVHPRDVGNAATLEGVGFWHQFLEMELVRSTDYRMATVTARLPESLVPADDYIITYIHGSDVYGSSRPFTVTSESGAIRVLTDHRDNEYHFLDNPFSIDWQVPHVGESLPERWNVELLKETTVGNFEYQLHFTTSAYPDDSFFSGGLDWSPYNHVWTPGNKLTPGKYKVKVTGIGSDLEGVSEITVRFGERQGIEVISPGAGDVRTLLTPLTARFRVPAGGQGPFDVEVNCGIGLSFSFYDVDCPECPATYPQSFETTINRSGATPEMINAVPADGSLECKLQVTSETDPDLTGEGEPFNVVLPELRVLSPAAGVTWRNGDEHLITWEVDAYTGSSFNIKVKSEPPGVLHSLAFRVMPTPSSDGDQGQYNWTVGYPTGGDAVYRERGGADLDGTPGGSGSATLAAYLDLPAGAYRILIKNDANHGWQAYSEVFNIVDE